MIPALPLKDGLVSVGPHVLLATLAAFSAIARAVNFAAQEGFGVRGGAELGEIYWKNGEAIGPAFLDAYALERHADVARVLAGPALLDELAKLQGLFKRPSLAHYNMALRYLREALDPSEGGLMAFGNVESSELGQLFREIQNRAPEHLRYKYQELIQRVAVTVNDKIRREIRRSHLERSSIATRALLDNLS